MFWSHFLRVYLGYLNSNTHPCHKDDFNSLIPNPITELPHRHRRSQEGNKGATIVILCFERQYPKQNSVFRLILNILPPKIFLLATLLPITSSFTNAVLSEHIQGGGWGKGEKYSALMIFK